MTKPPDPQLADSFGNGIFFILLVAFNVWTRFRSNKKLATKIDTSLDAKVLEIEAASKLLRESLDSTREAMGKLTGRIEDAEKADDRLRSEMHALTGRVDTANATYTEILQKAKAREAKAQAQASRASLEPGKRPDVQDQTKVTLKKEEKPK